MSEEKTTTEPNKLATEINPILSALLGLTILIYFAASFYFILNINQKIDRSKLNEEALHRRIFLETTQATQGKEIEQIRIHNAFCLEMSVISKRYEQASYLVLTRTLIKYFGFATGMILAIFGSLFIINRIKEEPTEIKADPTKELSFYLKSSSPGIIFGVLGTALMIVAMVFTQEISVQDMNLYYPSNSFRESQNRSDVNGIDAYGMQNIVPKYDSINPNDTVRW